MNYLKTSDVKVFPSTKRASKQVSARLMTEQAIVGIVNKLIDTDGFVITKKEVFNDYVAALEHTFEFNIFGYYFNINKLQEIVNLYNDTDGVNEIYGNIQIAETGNYGELFGQDDGGIYQGISFTPTPLVVTENRKVHSLLLLKREDSNSPWYVPDESRIRFEFNSVEPNLDAGEI